MTKRPAVHRMGKENKGVGIRADGRYVLVAHPGTQHSHQTALAFQKAGMLQNYVTGFFYKNAGVLAWLVGVLPRKYAGKLEEELLRRRKDELDQNLIRTFPLAELIYIILARLKYTRKWSGWILRWRNRRFDRLVAKLVEAERPDAVICYDSCALETFGACKSIGALAILDQSIGHLASGINILGEEATLHPEFAGSLLADTPGSLVEQCSAEARAADIVLAASEYVKRTLIENGVAPSRIAIVPYGVDTERFCPATERGDGIFRVLFVGGISQRKGIKYLLEAFRQLDLPNAELVLAGGISLSEEAQQPYRGMFRHVRNVPHSEVHRVFQRADIFVYPSLHEGSALAIYEALACGLPVITTPNSGSVVRDGVDGFIVPIRDIATLKERIRLLYQNKALRVEMGRRARERAETFTWDVYQQKLRMLVKDIVLENKA